MVHSPQFLKLVQDAKQRVKETNVPDVKRRIDAGEKMILVDVREDNEWAKGHLPGAVHMGKGVIERDIEQRVPDTGTQAAWYFIAAVVFRSTLVSPIICKKWNLPALNRWMAAGLRLDRSGNARSPETNPGEKLLKIGWGGRIPK